MVDTHILTHWVHVFSWVSQSSLRTKRRIGQLAHAYGMLFEALCLQTWLAGKSPTGFLDFPMKRTCTLW